MGEKLLSTAFALAKEGMQEADEGKINSARGKLSAAISAFEACLKAPGFINDPQSRSLILKEVGEIKAKREALKSITKTQEAIEHRVEKLRDEHHHDNLRERLDALTQMDKPAVPVDQLESRFRALKEDSACIDTRKATVNQASSTKPKMPPAFQGDDWKKGLDPEVVALMEQVRDETFGFD